MHHLNETNIKKDNETQKYLIFVIYIIHYEMQSVQQEQQQQQSTQICISFCRCLLRFCHFIVHLCTKLLLYCDSQGRGSNNYVNMFAKLNLSCNTWLYMLS